MDAIKTKRMKSIKEKIRSDYPKSDILEEELSRVGYRVGFEKGANYVLEKIEKLTNNQNWCAFPKQSHKELKELIEQLKR